MKFKQTVAAILLAGLLGGRAQAQHLLLVAPIVSGSINDPITFDIFADGNIGGAVAWGTIAALSDPVNMTYVPNYDGMGHSYRTFQPFFDTDLTDTSLLGNGQLKLNFLNTTPGANFGYNGYTPLAEFQVLVGSGVHTGTNLTVGLAALGIPPDGTAVQDDTGNNILLPTDPNRPLDNVSTAYIAIGGSGSHLSWNIGSSAVPEPAGWLAMLAGSAGALCLRRRRHA